MVRFGRILLTAAILGAAVIGGAQVALATPKPDVVLINQPASSVRVRKTFTVGVWYQQFSGARGHIALTSTIRAARAFSTSTGTLLPRPASLKVV